MKRFLAASYAGPAARERENPARNAEPFLDGKRGAIGERDEASHSNEQRAEQPHVLPFGLSEAALLKRALSMWLDESRAGRVMVG